MAPTRFIILYNLDRTLEDKETEVSQMYKRMTVLHSQNEAQGSRLEEMEAELAHVHQELDDLQSQCEDKDAQVRKILSPPLYPGSFSNNCIT